MATPQMIAHLNGVSTLGVFLKLTSRDGDVLAVCNGTRNKVINGITYFVVPMQPSQLDATNQLKADNLELVAILGGLFTAKKLRARKWFGARVEYMVYNYKDFSMDVALKKTTFIGDVEIGKFTAKPELLSLSNKLSEPTGYTMLETCNCVRLGDARCGVNLSGNTVQGYRIRTTATVSAVSNRQQFTVTFSQTVKPSDATVLIAPDGFYANGEAEFTGGNNQTLITRVLANTGNAVTLWLPAFYDVAVGDTVTLTAGDDRTIKTCVEKFGNGVRYRGYPYLPGRARLFHFPG